MSSSKDMAFLDFRRKNNMAAKKQDDVKNGRQTDPMGQYFAMGTSKFVYQRH